MTSQIYRTLFFGIYSLFLCLSGAYYTFQLHKIISRMMGSNHKTAVSVSKPMDFEPLVCPYANFMLFLSTQAIESVKRIQRAVISMLIACVILMTAIVWRFFIDTCHREDQLAENTSYIWFATFVHACEALVAVALYALFKPASNVQKNQSKNRGN